MQAGEWLEVKDVAAEQKKVSAPTDEAASVEDKLNYLLAQSEVFGHFLAGTMAASGKKRGGGKKNGSRGKKNRMSEAEEDAQLLKTAESKRSVIRLDKQVRVSFIVENSKIKYCDTSDISNLLYCYRYCEAFDSSRPLQNAQLPARRS